jgi:hypothetical protein
MMPGVKVLYTCGEASRRTIQGALQLHLQQASSGVGRHAMLPWTLFIRQRCSH